MNLRLDLKSTGNNHIIIKYGKTDPPSSNGKLKIYKDDELVLSENVVVQYPSLTMDFDGTPAQNNAMPKIRVVLECDSQSIEKGTIIGNI